MYYDIMKKACENDNICFDETMYEKFMKYKTLIKEWNEKINLTAITEDDEIIKKHFIDCIKCLRFDGIIKAENIIDIGTGAGFPGVPISIMKEEKNVVLLDSLNKRINFLNTVIQDLSLNNVKAIHGRAEELARKKEYREFFDIAISRAVANMTVLCELSIPFVKLNGYFVAMKGPSVDEELNEAKNAIATLGGRLEDIIKVEIENSDLRHNMVIIKKIKATSDVYPRKAGSITKKPLR
jgi:16S rRNA (guanine(527)-N(7))-methyltransferase GidB